MRTLILSLIVSSAAFAASPDSLRSLDGASNYAASRSAELANTDLGELKALASHEDARVARTARALMARMEHPELAAFVADVQPGARARNGDPRFIGDTFTEPGIAPLLMERVLHGDDSLAIKNALVGRVLGHEGWQQELAEAFADLEPATRAVVVQFAARDRKGGTAPLLEAAISDSSPEVRASALRASASVPEVSTALVAAALGDADASVRADAAWSLGVVGGPEHADALRGLLTDGSVDVRLRALGALERLSPGILVDLPELEALSTDADARIRGRVERIRAR